MRRNNLFGKHIVIVGASSGIGLAVTRRLAQSGCLLGIASRNAKALESLAKEFPDNIVWERLDVTDADCGQSLQRLIEKTGGMDCYFHIAGIGHDSNNLDPERQSAMTATNVDGFTRMVDAAFRYFRDNNNGEGHIAAITSIAGTNGLGQLAAYSSTKRYQQIYLRSLNQLASIKRLRIRFTDLRPGWVKTPLLPEGNSYPMLMDAEKVAMKIERALKRRRRVQIIDWRWNIVVALWRLIPNSIWVKLRINPGSLG